MHPVTLRDDVVTLSAPTPDDVDVITAICQDPEIQAWTVVPSPYRREDAVWFVDELVRSGWDEDRERTWAVRVDGRLLGMVGLARKPVRCAEVGYWMAPDARGRGLLHRSLRLVLDHAFDPAGMDVDRVEWKAYGGNWRSWRAVWRLGFRFEGALRLGGVQRDLRRDDWVAGLLRDDPREPVLPWPGTTVEVPGHPPEPVGTRARADHERIHPMTSTTSTVPPLDPANPFAAPSDLPYGLPDFAAIRDEHYLPAFEAGMAEERAEVEAIVTDPEPPTEENLLLELERSGALLDRVSTVFFSRTSADTTDALDALEEQLAPRLAEHHDAIYLDRRLHDRLEALQAGVDAGDVTLPDDAAWLLHTLRRDVRRAGVALDDDAKARLRELNGRITSLETAFGRELLADTNASAVLVEDEAELDGLPEDAVAAARQAAQDRGHDTGWLVELMLYSQQPVLASLRRRDVRRRVHEASVGRGARGGAHDTRAILLELARLRAERARLLGFEHHAAYVADDATARTTEAVDGMLHRLAPAAAANARREAADLERALQADEPGATLEPWDWSFYAERVRQERYALDDALLRPYLELDRVLHDGVFHAATELYGITFARRKDLVGYHHDVQVYEVHDADGSGLGLFLADWYTRPSKRGGAWMNNLVDQSRLLGDLPVVMNNLNIPKPPADEPTLLSWDEVITMFHEFGHALHGLFSAVRLPSQSGTAVPRDFVEYPSQVNEMWAWEPSVLRRYAVHHETGEPMPAEWVETMLASRQFNEGFSTTEYLAAALLDQAWHQMRADEVPTEPDEVTAFEAGALDAAGIAVHAVPPRYRTTYFNHVFGGGYAAAYYSYIWSEVLDADTVEWFAENGGLRRENGDRFRQVLLSRGGSLDVMDTFRELRGRDPEIGPLLARRGLDGGA